ncbi:MAG: hypothetical protein JWN48_1923 [Myxococcaceae bacterium]|nr:hypothetical protein [Myxococcaceae bacterium]
MSRDDSARHYHYGQRRLQTLEPSAQEAPTPPVQGSEQLEPLVPQSSLHEAPPAQTTPVQVSAPVQSTSQTEPEAHTPVHVLAFAQSSWQLACPEHCKSQALASRQSTEHEPPA